MKKALLVILVILVVIVVGVLMARNIIVKTMLENWVEKLIGLKIRLKSIDIGIFKTDVEVKELEVDNPAGYSDKYLTQIPDIYIDYALEDIIHGFMHFPEIDINIKQVNVEKNKDGVLNLDSIQSTSEKPKEKKKSKDKAKDEKGDFLINKMSLEIDTIKYMDNSKTPPTKDEFKLNYSKNFENVTDPKVIVDSIVGAVVGKLITKGIDVSVKSILSNEDFIGSALKGDEKGMEGSAEESLEGLFGGKKSEEKSGGLIKKPLGDKSTKNQTGEGAADKLFGNILK